MQGNKWPNFHYNGDIACIFVLVYHSPDKIPDQNLKRILKRKENNLKTVIAIHS